MLFFIIGFMLGSLAGITTMCLLQINRLSRREDEMYAETKRTDSVPAERK